MCKIQLVLDISLSYLVKRLHTIGAEVQTESSLSHKPTIHSAENLKMLQFIMAFLLPVVPSFLQRSERICSSGPNCIKQFWRLPEHNRHLTVILWPTRFDVTIETIVTSTLIGQIQPVRSRLSNQLLCTIQCITLIETGHNQRHLL